MASKPLDGLLIILAFGAIPADSVQSLRDKGAFVLVKRPGTEPLQVKRLATGEPLDVALNIMDPDMWARLVALREQLASTEATEAVQVVQIP